MAQRTMVEAINQALALELERDRRVLIFGEDVGRAGGVFRVTDGLQARFGEQRVFDTPIAESGIIGTAVGMAAAGLRPIPEIQFMGFSLLAVNQIAAQVARMHWRSGGRYPMSMVIRTCYGGPVRSPELHSDSLEALFAHVPGLKIVCPSSPYEAKGLLHAAVADPDPVLYLENLRLYRTVREEVPDDHYTLPLGEARVARPGSQVSVIAWGGMVPPALQAADAAAARGIDVEVLDLRSLSPLDVDAIARTVQKSGRVVVVHEAVRTGGFGAEVVAVINERALWSLLAPVVRVTGLDTHYPVLALEQHFIPDAQRILAGIEEALKD